MTTEAHGTHQTRTAWVRGTVAAAGGALAVGTLLAAAGAVVDGRPAAVGAMAGSLLVGVVLALGTMVVGMVSDLMPGASLVVALLTYTLEIAALALLLAALRGWDGVAEALTPSWFAAGVVGAALVWTVVQVVVAVRTRIPAFDLPAPAPVEGTRAAEEGLRR